MLQSDQVATWGMFYFLHLYPMGRHQKKSMFYGQANQRDPPPPYCQLFVNIWLSYHFIKEKIKSKFAQILTVGLIIKYSGFYAFT